MPWLVQADLLSEFFDAVNADVVAPVASLQDLLACIGSLVDLDACDQDVALTIQVRPHHRETDRGPGFGMGPRLHCAQGRRCDRARDA